MHKRSNTYPRGPPRLAAMMIHIGDSSFRRILTMFNDCFLKNDEKSMLSKKIVKLSPRHQSPQTSRKVNIFLMKETMTARQSALRCRISLALYNPI